MKWSDGMEADLKWVIGLGVSLCVFVATTLIATFRTLSAKIAKTHERIDDVKDKYVRRDDLDGHLTRIDRTVHEIREEMRDNHKQVIAALSKK